MLDFPEKPYRGYIFDCDGTLADSMPLHLAAWNHALAESGAPLQIDGKAFMSVAGMAFRQTVEYWNEVHATKIDADQVVPLRNAFFETSMHTIRPIEPVTTFARQCHERGAAVAVASGGTHDHVLQTLEVIGMGGFFPVVVTAEDVERAKPAPDLFLLAARKLDLPPEDCLVLEDSPLGVQAANACGMDSLLIPHQL